MFKGKYLIGVYAPIEDGETLLGLCNNVREFATFLKIKYDNARKIIQRLFNGETHFIRLCNKICSVEFIDISEEE